MYEMEAKITKRIFNEEAYYTLIWSALAQADKYKINRVVPAVSGVFELYRMDKEKHLNLLTATQAWYGGLRSNIREAIDPINKTDPDLKKLLEDEEENLYYRYSTCDSFKDMLDVVWFLHSSYFPEDIRVDHSHRYKNFFLKEKSPDKVFWLENE